MRSFFVRNFLKEAVAIDVFATGLDNSKNFPASVKLADRVVGFRPHFRNAFKSAQALNWKTATNFTITLSPQSSVDVTPLIARAVNPRSSNMNYIAVVRTRKRTDTLFSEMADISNLKNKSAGFMDYVSYYDVR